jgi:cytochrome c oxidase subunit II
MERNKRWARAGMLAAAALLTLASAPQAPAAQERRVVRIRAERFAFTPSEVSLNAGETIELRIKSDDTAHGFHIVGGETNVTIPKRGQGEIIVVFKSEKPGRYEFQCSRMCGAGHSFMRGVLVVKGDR